MSAAVEMLSPNHFFGQSPPTGFLSDYSAVRSKKTYIKPVKLTLKTASKSCLRVEEKQPKKQVIFADDRGLALEHVRIMSEPSNVPPQWALKCSPPVQKKPVPVDLWEPRFKQPASDYLEFRRKITEDCVSLENVIIKQKDGSVDGTVKVKNLDYSKEVFVRTTSDGWSSHEDNFCAFLEAGPILSGTTSAYDTFSFKLQLPIHSRKMEFCVCFRCMGKEYWDGNNGSNYVIEKQSVRIDPAVACVRLNYGNSWKSRTDTLGNTPYW